MKRRMKLLLAEMVIGALTLIFGCPLWWICMIDYWKAAMLRLPLLARRIAREKTASPKNRETFWGNNREEGEQLI